MAKPTTTTSPSNKPKARDVVSRGKVQRIYPERGFGFIRCLEGASDDVGQDFFFHMSGLDDCRITELLEGTLVVFESTLVPKGKRAEHVHIDREGA